MRRTSSRGTLGALLLAMLLAVACTDVPVPVSPTATASPAVPTAPAPIASPPASTGANGSCLNTELPAVAGDPWARARALLPQDTLLRPGSVPARFDGGRLIAACVDATGRSQYTVVYSALEEPRRELPHGMLNEVLVLILNHGAGAWGNTPGPPTSVGDVEVRGVPGRISLLAARTAGGQSLPPFSVLSWSEGGQR